MLRLLFKIMNIINSATFIIAFFIILKNLNSIDNRHNLIHKIIKLSTIVIIILSRPKFYQSLEYIVISVILLSFICKVIYNLNLKKSIYYASIYSSVYMILDLTIYYILLYIYVICINKYRWVANISIELIDCILFNLCVFLFIYNFDKAKKLYENYKYYIYIVLTIIINLIIISFIYISTYNIYNLLDTLLENKIYYNSKWLNMSFLSFADRTLPYIIVVINVVFITLLINSIKIDKEESKIKVMNEKIDLQYNYYKTVQESQDRVKKLYHDINNHVANINIIQNNNYNISKYIEDINNELKDFNSIYETKNMLLDTILNEKNRICREKNIEFICDINFEKCNFMEMIDITSIFSNLLDNSIEACSKIDNNQIKKYIKIRGTTVKKYYIIRCENTKVNTILTKNNKILSSKKDKFIHGIGIESIKSSLKKYDGEFKVKSEDDKFIASIYIPV